MFLPKASDINESISLRSRTFYSGALTYVVTCSSAGACQRNRELGGPYHTAHLFCCYSPCPPPPTQPSRSSLPPPASCGRHSLSLAWRRVHRNSGSTGAWKRLGLVCNQNRATHIHVQWQLLVSASREVLSKLCNPLTPSWVGGHRSVRIFGHQSKRIPYG